MKLSHRLLAIASFVPPGSAVADIGTDHGYIPIYLAENDIAVRALAVDVRPGPLKRAAAHILESGVDDRVQVRLGDGMTCLKPGEADCLVISGIGGELLIKILEEGRNLWPCIKDMVLSPQSDIEKVRRYLEKEGFCIGREDMIKEDGKYYTVMGVTHGKMAFGREIDYFYGKLLIGEKNQVLKEYLSERKAVTKKLAEKIGEKSSGRARERYRELLEELSRIEEAQREML